MPCANNSSQTCGGSWGLSVYQLASTAGGNPSQANGYNSLGCYAEKPGARALRNSFTSAVMTSQLCAARALAGGAAFFGLEYGQECWWDTVLDGAVPADQSNCFLNCTGSAFQKCGGQNFLQLYGNRTLPPNPTSTMYFSSPGAALPTISQSSALVLPSTFILETSSSSSTTNPAASSVATTSSTTSATASTTTSTALSSPFSAISSPVSTSSSAVPSPTPLSCPSNNGTTYTSPGGRQYLVECGIDRVGQYLSSSIPSETNVTYCRQRHLHGYGIRAELRSLHGSLRHQIRMH
jgi:hypothetical protein